METEYSPEPKEKESKNEFPSHETQGSGFLSKIAPLLSGLAIEKETEISNSDGNTRRHRFSVSNSLVILLILVGTFLARWLGIF